MDQKFGFNGFHGGLSSFLFCGGFSSSLNKCVPWFVDFTKYGNWKSQNGDVIDACGFRVCYVEGACKAAYKKSQG